MQKKACEAKSQGPFVRATAQTLLLLAINDHWLYKLKVISCKFGVYNNFPFFKQSIDFWKGIHWKNIDLHNWPIMGTLEDLSWLVATHHQSTKWFLGVFMIYQAPTAALY